MKKKNSSDNKLENLNIIEEAGKLKQRSKKINQEVSIKILKITNQLFNFEKYNEEQEERRTLERKKRDDEIKEMKNVESSITESCFIGIIILFCVFIFIYYGFGIE